MKNTIFLSSNPTDKFLVIADDWYSEHDDLNQAEKAYTLACPGSIDDSIWGAIRMMAPYHVDAYAHFVDAEYRATNPISDVTMGRVKVENLAEKATEIQDEQIAKMKAMPKVEPNFNNIFANWEV